MLLCDRVGAVIYFVLFSFFAYCTPGKPATAKWAFHQAGENINTPPAIRPSFLAGYFVDFLRLFLCDVRLTVVFYSIHFATISRAGHNLNQPCSGIYSKYSRRFLLLRRSGNNGQTYPQLFLASFRLLQSFFLLCDNLPALFRQYIPCCSV